MDYFFIIYVYFKNQYICVSFLSIGRDFFLQTYAVGYGIFTGNIQGKKNNFRRQMRVLLVFVPVGQSTGNTFYLKVA